MIDGEKIRFGSQDYIVPALNLKQLRTLSKKIDSVLKGNPSSDEEAQAQYDATIEVIQAALTRNYPEISMDFVETYVDMNNMQQVVLAILGRSGIKQADGNEKGTPLGE